MDREQLYANLNKMKAVELRDLCKSKKLPVSGKKEILINRILDFDKQNPSIEQFIIQNKAKQLAQKPKKEVKPKIVKRSPPHILKKIEDKQSIFKAYLNEFDRKNVKIEDKIFVVNDNNKINGIENESITEEFNEINIDLINNICHKYRLDYEIPNNLLT